MHIDLEDEDVDQLESSDDEEDGQPLLPGGKKASEPHTPVYRLPAASLLRHTPSSLHPAVSPVSQLPSPPPSSAASVVEDDDGSGGDEVELEGWPPLSITLIATAGPPPPVPPPLTSLVGPCLLYGDMVKPDLSARMIDPACSTLVSKFDPPVCFYPPLHPKALPTAGSHHHTALGALTCNCLQSSSNSSLQAADRRDAMWDFLAPPEWGESMVDPKTEDRQEELEQQRKEYWCRDLDDFTKEEKFGWSRKVPKWHLGALLPHSSRVEGRDDLFACLSAYYKLVHYN